jgi:uncharacterized protein (TIGR02246 family)
MKNMSLATLLTTLFATFIVIPSLAAAEVSEQELMTAAESLAKQYDDNYNAKNPAGMAGLYTADGVLVLGGAVIRGTENFKPYYQSRFDAGAGNHVTKVSEVHVQGDGGFGVGNFSAVVSTPDGAHHDIKGNLAMVYQHGADGWHLRLVVASVPPPPSPK